MTDIGVGEPARGAHHRLAGDGQASPQEAVDPLAGDLPHRGGRALDAMRTFGVHRQLDLVAGRGQAGGQEQRVVEEPVSGPDGDEARRQVRGGGPKAERRTGPAPVRSCGPEGSGFGWHRRRRRRGPFRPAGPCWVSPRGRKRRNRGPRPGAMAVAPRAGAGAGSW